MTSSEAPRTLKQPQLKEHVFVTGHRNPDMDSVCSSWAYAKLKNLVDPARLYIPIRGHMNDITRMQFSRLGIQAPMYVNSIRPRVYDIIQRVDTYLYLDDPIYRLCFYFTQTDTPQVPIFERNDNSDDTYSTILTIDEISRYFLKISAHTHPRLNFLVDNFGKLINGTYLKKGALKEFETSIVIGMMSFAFFEDYMKKVKSPKPIVLVGNRRKHLELSMRLDVPAIIIVGLSKVEDLKVDISNYNGTVFVSNEDTDKTLQLLKMSIPIQRLIGHTSPPIVKPTDLFDDVKQILLNSSYNSLPVINDEGQFYGIVSKDSFMIKPKKKVIMMDHNELNQGLPGLEDAEIFEIIDHHRLAAEKTQKPIFMDIEPLGSTCTLVYGLYRKHDREIDQETALVLLSGIINDTVILKSPTTTQIDREVVMKLMRIAGIRDLKEFGQTMFSGGASITTQDPRKLITADFKTFEEYGVKFGIGQCEVTQFDGVEEIKDKWLEVLEDVRKQNQLEWAMIVITNIIMEDSLMLSTPYPKTKLLKYEEDKNGIFHCPGVLSRKIQILPEVIRVLSNEN